MDNTTTNKPKPRPEGVPDIQKVEWLIPVLNLDGRQQAYNIVRTGQIPANCVLRFGRRIRLIDVLDLDSRKQAYDIIAAKSNSLKAA